MNDREAFLAAIASDPCDCELRAIYADWLEERGETAEADRQRRWPEVMAESRRWIAEMAEQLGGPGSYEDDEADGGPLTYDGLLQAANDYLDHNDYYHMWSNENYKSCFHGHEDEFWKHYEIVTGRKPSETGAFFSCSC